MIELTTQIADRIPAAANRPGISAETARRLENMRTSSAAVKKEATAMDAIAVRILTATDAESLRRLAQRDTAEVPAGRVLAVEASGALIAALSLDDGSVVADPFRETASAVELLQLRARQIGGSGPRRRRFPHLPRARGAIAGSPPGGGSHLLQL